MNNFFDDGGSTPERKHKPDYLIVIIAIILLIIGLIVMYSISPALAAAEGVSQHYFVTKQFVAIGLGLLAFVLFSYLPLKFLRRSKRTLIWLSFIMILAVHFFGEQRWIQIGGFSFQSAELVKFTVVVWAACFLFERLANSEIKSTPKTLYPILILIGLVGFFIAGLQSDLGSAGVIVAIAVVMAFAAGMPVKRLAVIGGIVAVGTVIAIASTPYRQDRLTTFLNPASDCQAAGYQSCQALIAIGSGGMFGLGVGNGVQAYGYLPEAENDSIFAIVGEKFGFVGTGAIIGLYALLFSRMRRVILHTSDAFSRLLVIGVLTWLGIQTIINIGAMIGLLPLKGITLPFISYGGTSLVFVMAAVGVVFKISRYMAYSPVRNVALTKNEEGPRDNSISGRRQRRPYYASVSGR
ncbi:putative lipid II flippase FtsW [Candidatus Parcubacteria bacterium]|nr:putative lipid II flippase FtsW [Candidatus Parcubacteria bacterium]